MSTSILSWLDEVFETPVLEDLDTSTVLPRRGVLAFTGAGVTVTDDETDDQTTVTIPGPTPPLQNLGILAVNIPDANTMLTPTQASYQGLVIGCTAGALSAPRTLTYPTLTPDANGAVGGLVTIANASANLYPITIAVTGGTETQDIAPGLCAVLMIHASGARIASTAMSTS